MAARIVDWDVCKPQIGEEHPVIPEVAENFPGFIFTEVPIELSLKDRLRLLFGDRISVRVTTATSVEVTSYSGASIWWRHPGRSG